MKSSRMRHTFLGLGGICAASVVAACDTAPSDASTDSVESTTAALSENYAAVGQAIQFQASSLALPAMWYSSPSLGDFDNDGDLDLVVIGSEESGGYPSTSLPGIAVLRNDGSTFSEQTIHPQGDPLIEAYRGSAQWGDYDGDGRADLFIGGGRSIFGGPISVIYHNDGVFQGGLKFTVAYVDAGFGLEGDGTWGDFDHDGDLDLAYCGASAGGAAQTTVLRNDAGAFTVLPNVFAPAGYCDVNWVDYDGDGRLDLFVAGDEGSFLYRNDNSGFVDTGIQFPFISGSWGGVASAWGDFDSDGDPDLLISGMAWTGVAHKPLTAIYRNDNGRFFHHPMPFGDHFIVNPAATWADVNSDGAVDLFLMGGGEWGNNGPVVRSRWYENVAGDFSKDAYFDLRGMYEGDVAVGDVDRDGDLDVVITGAARNETQPSTWERSTMLYINTLR